eukprot:CAMPEP_0172589642 /NCGR_PEP_ID=MMETSP1068-20121228/8295_1 /TAXON_ID=35684 /ORGANISM="Pseudopedinella elastica, Strain CCMP716" /LENGTH=125 /DNA_ID=CAMNT_0013385277 /DNA_START=153 /DNA_END=526 /DNA_ORIENTATION=-
MAARAAACLASLAEAPVPDAITKPANTVASTAPQPPAFRSPGNMPTLAPFDPLDGLALAGSSEYCGGGELLGPAVVLEPPARVENVAQARAPTAAPQAARSASAKASGAAASAASRAASASPRSR